MYYITFKYHQCSLEYLHKHRSHTSRRARQRRVLLWLTYVYPIIIMIASGRRVNENIESDTLAPEREATTLLASANGAKIARRWETFELG